MRMPFLAFSAAILISVASSAAGAANVADRLSLAAPSPDTIAAQHLVVMQAAIVNYSATRKVALARAGRGVQPSSRDLLEAMLQVDGVPTATKAVVKDALAAPSSRPMSATCQRTIYDLLSRAPSSGNSVRPLITYFQLWSRRLTICPELGEGVRAAIAVLERGESTIYDPQWLQVHFDGGATHDPGTVEFHIPWKKIARVALADAGGAISNCCDEGGMIFGAIGGSLSAI